MAAIPPPPLPFSLLPCEFAEMDMSPVQKMHFFASKFHSTNNYAKADENRTEMPQRQSWRLNTPSTSATQRILH